MADPADHDLDTLDGVFDYGQELVAEAGGRPVTLVDWHAPGMTAGEVAEADRLVKEARTSPRGPGHRP